MFWLIIVYTCLFLFSVGYYAIKSSECMNIYILIICLKAKYLSEKKYVDYNRINLKDN